jgi:hypothetical protein
LTGYLDGIAPHLIVLHGTLGPLDDRLDVLAVVAIAFMLLCLVGYIGRGRNTEQVTVRDTESDS